MKTNFAKITVTTLLMGLVILVTTCPVAAQQDNLNNSQQENQILVQTKEINSQNTQLATQYHKQYFQGKKHGDQHKNIEAQRIAFITQELSLTPDEAKVFWPVYNEYDTKRHELKKSFKESGDFHKTDYEKLTEKEANQILDNQIIEAQKFLDLRKEYHAKFRSVLPAVKVVKLYNAERDFQKMLMDKLRQHRQTTAPQDKK